MWVGGFVGDVTVCDARDFGKKENQRKRKEAAAKRHRRAVLAKSHKRVYQKQTYAACTIQRYWGKFIILKKIRFIIAWHEDNQKTEALGSKFVIAESKRFQQELKRNRTKRRTKIHRYVKNADEFRKAADRYQKFGPRYQRPRPRYQKVCPRYQKFCPR